VIRPVSWITGMAATARRDERRCARTR